MATPSTPDRGQATSWQAQLQDYCRLAQYPAPVYNILSDRRGGRTAWSSTVMVNSPSSNGSQLVQARYWYDGQHVNNAKEDCAEVALRMLRGASPGNSSATTSSPFGPGPGGDSPPGPGAGPGAGPSPWPNNSPTSRRR